MATLLFRWLRQMSSCGKVLGIRVSGFTSDRKLGGAGGELGNDGGTDGDMLEGKEGGCGEDGGSEADGVMDQDQDTERPRCLWREVWTTRKTRTLTMKMNRYLGLTAGVCLVGAGVMVRFNTVPVLSWLWEIYECGNVTLEKYCDGKLWLEGGREG